MWFTIIAVMALVIIYFVKDVSKVKQEVSDAGGMKVRYSLLIKRLLEGDPRTKIYSETSTSVVVGLEVMGGYAKFNIQQGFDVVVIQWESESNIFGAKKLEWKFNEQMNQQKMFENICIDISNSNEETNKAIALKYGNQNKTP